MLVEGNIGSALAPAALDGRLGTALISRARLVRRLIEAPQVPLVVLVAPAGYGKTTLLAEWAARDGRPFGWVSTSATPLAAIARALAEAGVLSRGRLPALERAESALLLHELRSCGQPFVLVIDAPDSPLIDAVGAIAAALPTGAQIAIASRHEPGLPLGRLRAQGAVTELRARDLAMTRFEAAAILDQAGLEPAADEVETLLARTEGWPAGLQLAALALADQREDPGAVERFGGGDYVVADYVRDEFIAGTDADTRGFMLRSSVLERLTGPLCDAVLERRDSARRLSDFARGNVPVTRLDRNGVWYRYHRLFAEALRAELRRTDPELEVELHGRASLWHEAAGDVGLALHHAVAAGDAERATRLLWTHLAGYLGTGRGATVMRWVERLGECAASSPRLALVAAHAELAQGRLDLARRWAASAASRLEPGDDALEAAAALVRAAAADEGPARMRADARSADERLAPTSPWRAMASLLCGVADYLSGDRAAARAQLEEGVRRGVVDAPDIQSVCLAELALLAADEEDWEGAASNALRARAQVERYGIADSPMSALVLAAAALVRAQRGNVDDANADLRRAAAIVDELTEPIPWYAAQTRIALARAALRLSDVVGSRRHAAQAAVTCSRMSESGSLHAAVAEAFARIDAFSPAGDVTLSSLTTAELRILQFLPTHLSFREIAERLFVSTNTVKTQAHAVYRKLDVSSRSGAVGRARAIGLLDA